MEILYALMLAVATTGTTLYDVIIALAVPLNTLLLVTLALRQSSSVRRGKHVDEKTTRLVKMLNGGIAEDETGKRWVVTERGRGGRRSYDLPE